MSQRYIGGLIYNPPGGFSGYFDGSGDYLQLADSTAWDLTGDYTIEMWLYKSSSASQTFFQLGTSSNILLYQNASNAIIFYSGSAVITSSATAPLNQWNHFALVRSGGGSNNTVMYLNGVNVGQATNTTSFTGDASNGVRIGAEYPTGFEFTGYISNVRVVKGTAVYTTAFTPPNGPLQAITNTSLLTCAYPTFRDGSSNNFTITVNGNTAVSTQNPFPQTQLPNPALGNQGNGVYSMSQYQALRSQNLWPAIDPYFDYVTLMLHGNGTNGAQNNTFLDSSTNNFTITRNGNTTQGTFTPYGANWSNYFDGNGDYLSVAGNAAFQFGTGAFSIEGWFNMTNFNPVGGGSQPHIISINSYTNGVMIRPTADAASMQLFIGNTTYTYSVTLYTNTWYHFAATRSSGGSVKFFLNGTQLGTTQTNTYNISTNSSNTIGTAVHGLGEVMAGYLSSIRVSNIERTITVPTAPYASDANTVLLTCQSNRFIDNSTNNFTITRNGDVSVQRFSPFNPTTPYAAGTIGGSGYFDGSGDYLSATTAASLGSGDFTVECWVYFTSAPGADTGNIICSYNYYTAGFNGNVVFRLGTSYGGRIFNGQTLVAEISGTFTWPLYTWTHVAWVRSGSTITLYKNGVSIGSMTASTNLSDFANGFVVGASRINGTVGEYSTCYISNLRMVAGTAVYTTTFTPPTAPLTAITNTQLLLNMTNGGIIDNAMMNDLETVGNAQISTSVSKFGGGSMSFDGTGDWLLGPANQTIALGAGAYTAEFWLYKDSSGTGERGILQTQTASLYGLSIFADGTTLYIDERTNTYSATNPRISGTISQDVWIHVAVCREGGTSGTLRAFVNGVQLGSSVTSNLRDMTSTGPIYIGTTAVAANSFKGYIDDLRITKYARYTTNFTPQRSQWQDQ